MRESPLSPSQKRISSSKPRSPAVFKTRSRIHQPRKHVDEQSPAKPIGLPDVATVTLDPSRGRGDRIKPAARAAGKQAASNNQSPGQGRQQVGSIAPSRGSRGFVFTPDLRLAPQALCGRRLRGFALGWAAGRVSQAGASLAGVAALDLGYAMDRSFAPQAGDSDGAVASPNPESRRGFTGTRFTGRRPPEELPAA